MAKVPVSGAAQAILKKAEAWKQFSDAARLQTILEKLLAVLQASAGIFGGVAAPFGNIDKVVVIEQRNGGDGDGTVGIGRVARTRPASYSDCCNNCRRSASTFLRFLHSSG